MALQDQQFKNYKKSMPEKCLSPHLNIINKRLKYRQV